MWDKVVTIFNSRVVNGSDVYTKKVLKGVFVDNTSVVATNQGLENANKISLYIKDYNGYVEPKQFNGNGWTLKEGDKIVIGEVTGTYTSMVQLAKDYTTYTITSIDFKNFGSMPHFEVGGK